MANKKCINNFPSDNQMNGARRKRNLSWPGVDDLRDQNVTGNIGTFIPVNTSEANHTNSIQKNKAETAHCKA